MTNYNFQINKNNMRKPWDEIEAHVYPFTERTDAVIFAQRLARIFKAEIRMTEGKDPARLSGSYFRSN